MEALILFGLLIVLIALSIPIGITLGLATAVSFALTSDIPLVILAQKSFSALDSFPLLAIPFFILAGALMSYGASPSVWWPWRRPWWASSWGVWPW